MRNEKQVKEDFDFGFSFTNDFEENLNKLEEQQKSKDEIIENLNERINKLYKSINIFLDNLCKNPEKPTIHWPNRVEKINEYKQKLKSIVEEG